MPRITDFCSCIYVLGCRLSVVRLCDSDFGITPVDDITIGITCAAFYFHIANISLFIIIIITIIIITPCMFIESCDQTLRCMLSGQSVTSLWNKFQKGSYTKRSS